MKKILIYTLSITLSLFSTQLFAQDNTPADSLGLPGDNLNLYGVLNLFQQSATLESFEKKINDENSKVNNLDLNNDNNIDYINVIDNVNGSAHAIVLQTTISAKETQDLAVIEVEKDKDNKLFVQIIGDEALYGKDYIIEPNDKSVSEDTPNPGYKKDGNTTTINNYTTNQPVASWGIISYMYQPTYRVYVSPYRWAYYPNYWKPWRPMGYHMYYGYHRPYYGYYRRGYTYLAPVAHVHYGPRRTTSVTVINNRQSGVYRSTYNRTIVRQNTSKQNKPAQNQPVQKTNRVRKDNSNSSRNKNQATPTPQKETQNNKVQRTPAPQKQGGNRTGGPRKQGGNNGGGRGGRK